MRFRSLFVCAAVVLGLAPFLSASAQCMSVARWSLKFTGRGTRGAAEHGTEGADAFVAQVECYLRDRRAVGEPSHRFEHACLLAPGAEAEACFALEMAGEGCGHWR